MSIISLAEQDSHALLKYKSNRGSWKQNHYISNSKCNDGNIKWDSNGLDGKKEVKKSIGQPAVPTAQRIGWIVR